MIPLITENFEIILFNLWNFRTEQILKLKTNLTQINYFLHIKESKKILLIKGTNDSELFDINNKSLERFNLNIL